MAEDRGFSREGVELGVLGPLTVRESGRPVVIGPAKQRLLLGLLALQPNRTVGHEEIVDLLWDHDPPGTWLNLVHGYTSRLRKLLCPPGSPLGITGVRGAYSLQIDADRLDLLRFEELSRTDREGEDPADTVDRLAEALSCWRGPVLQGLSPALDEHPAAVALTQRWTDTVLTYADLALSLRQPERTIAPLEAVARIMPFHEGIGAKLMLALAASGRQATALKLHDDLRTRLADELGVEPSPEVRSVHLRVLRNDLPQKIITAPPGPSRPPRTLPRDIPDFTGRAVELRRLLETRPADNAAAVVAIDGMAGVGKTALAVRAAHLLAERYPDGQLFIDLRGHAPEHRPVSASAALVKLLRGLGITDDQVPDGLDERVSLWRTTLARRRVLVVLDNTSGVAQVRPLLPSGPGCLALVTSRRRLVGAEGARALSLEVPSADDAARLFRRVAGERAEREPEAVREIVTLCGHLPMAIRLAAARLHHRPTWTVEYLNDRLRRQRNRLELGSDETSVGAAFAVSYRQLTAEEREMFRFLGVQHDLDFDVHAAAALAGTSLAHAERILENLVDVHLLQQPSSGRYRFHDLLGEHAAETARSTDSRAACANARTRLLDYYLYMAERAASVLDSGRRTIPLAASHRPAGAPEMRNGEDALRWLDAEGSNLSAVIAEAAEHGRHVYVWQLARALWGFSSTRGHHQEWVETHRLALAAARTLRDRWAEAETLKNLGLAYWYGGHHEQAIAHNQEALALDQETGDRLGEAKTHSHLGFVYDFVGDVRRAFAHQEQALRLYRECGDEWGVNRALSGLGNAGRKLGRVDEAREYLDRALRMSDRIGDECGTGIAHLGLGYLHEDHDHATARRHFEHALRCGTRIGDRLIRALAHIGLGRMDQRTTRAEAAGGHYRQALSLAGELNNPQIEAEARDGVAIAERSQI